MLSLENFEEFIDEVNTNYYNFRLWIELNNEWVKIQDNFKTWHIPETMRYIISALQQVAILGMARMLDPAHMCEHSRLSVKFIIEESKNSEIKKYYNDKMQEKDMKKFEASNRQLRGEKIAHKTPGSKVKIQKAGAEKFFEITKQIINELKKYTNLKTPKEVKYNEGQKQAKLQSSLFIEAIRPQA